MLWYPKQEQPEEEQEKKNSMALVTMMHGDGAWKLVSVINELKLKKFKAFLVPASPDIPLPSIDISESSRKELCHIMKERYDEFEKNGGRLVPASTAAAPVMTLDTQKVAAAAGGNNYDEDADPLNAPAVLQAVKDFRKALEKSNTVQQKRRIQLVAQKLEQTKKTLKEGGPPPGLPPMPPPGGLPPPPPPAVAPKPAAVGAGRGVSNLPAWMTQQKKPEGPTAVTAEPPPKKQKRSVQDCRDEMRGFIASQIKHYMGEEEDSLIGFILQHVLDEKPMLALLEELKGVLEEDADAFLQSLQSKIGSL